jgi:transaldolase
MEIFLDSCNIEHIRRFADSIVGITTNPTILKKHFNEESPIKGILEIANAFPDLLINLQVCSTLWSDMVEDGKFIASLSDRFIVKVPLNEHGIIAIKHLSQLGIKTNATLCFSLMQAKLAQNAGATYISPFLGRLEDAGEDLDIFMDNLRFSIFDSKILGASVRNLEHCNKVVEYDFDAITIGADVFSSIFDIELLKIGERKFAEDSYNIK